MTNTLKLWLTLITIPLAISCASKEKLTNIDPKSQQEIEALSADISERVLKAHHLISPEQFQKVNQAFIESQEMAEYGEPYEEVHQKIMEARQHLKKIDKNVEVAQFHMPDVLAARQEALDEGAIGTEPLKEADDALEELGEELEEGDVNEVLEDKNEVRNMYVDAEINAIQQRELATIRQNLQEIEDMEGETYFETDIEKLRNKIRSTEKIIAQNKDSKNSYQPTVMETLHDSEVLHSRVQTTSWVMNESPRDVAMQLENDFEKINSVMNKTSTRDLSYNAKVNHLVGEAALMPMLEANLDETRQKALKKQRRLTDAQLENYQLSRQQDRRQAIQNKINQIRSEFNRDEVEVLVRGDDLIVRLVGINFAVGNADIPEDAKPMLKKLAKIIGDFQSPQVEIQGHTDATGDALYNERLSRQRARTVTRYLSHNTSLVRKRLEAEGYGFSRPVANNKTEEGRAMNRRIDIVLTSAVQ